jgi:hypothetical protein
MPTPSLTNNQAVYLRAIAQRPRSSYSQTAQDDLRALAALGLITITQAGVMLQAQITDQGAAFLSR